MNAKLERNNKMNRYKQVPLPIGVMDSCPICKKQLYLTFEYTLYGKHTHTDGTYCIEPKKRT
jgi:hypothetical protein